jgi:hypothetical protein
MDAGPRPIPFGGQFRCNRDYGGGRKCYANGTVNIVAVTTYWTSTGSIDVPRQWLANEPYPAALIPQSDGSLQRLQGAATDGSFSIPNVPAGSKSRHPAHTVGMEKALFQLDSSKFVENSLAR